jgi:hypothetical protein
VTTENASAATPSGAGAPLLPGAPLPDAVQAHLRRSLELLRDQAEDPAVRRRMDDVLAGRASLRDLARDDGFSAMMTPLVERGMQRLDDLTPEERARVEADAAALGRDEVPEHLQERPDDGPTPPAPSPGTW